MCNFYIMYWTASPEPLQKKYCFSLGPPMYRWSDEFRNLPAHASVIPARSHQSHYHHHHHYWEVLLQPQKTHNMNHIHTHTIWQSTTWLNIHSHNGGSQTGNSSLPMTVVCWIQHASLFHHYPHWVVHPPYNHHYLTISTRTTLAYPSHHFNPTLTSNITVLSFPSLSLYPTITFTLLLLTLNIKHLVISSTNYSWVVS